MRRARFLSEISALAMVVGCVLLLALSGSPEALLFLAPALLIAASLFSGRYVGEELITKFAARRTRRPRRSSSSPAPALRHPAIWPPRGSRLIAFSLATRPPPVRPLLRT